MSNDEQRCNQYHVELVDEFVAMTAANITKRGKELCVIINNNIYLADIGHTFAFDMDLFVENAMSSIIPLIRSKTVVQIGACDNIPQNKHDYKKVARNRLNRNKPKFLGDFVFAPIIYDQLYQFCCRVFAEKQMIAFVSMLEDIVSPSSVVRFDQTRAQPLIPYNTLVMENAFKSSCLVLLKHYKLCKQWQVGSQKGTTNKKRSAKDIWHCFRTVCLPKVSERCRNFHVAIPQNLIQKSTVKFSVTVPVIPPNHNNHRQEEKHHAEPPMVSNSHYQNQIKWYPPHHPVQYTSQHQVYQSHPISPPQTQLSHSSHSHASNQSQSSQSHHQYPYYTYSPCACCTYPSSPPINSPPINHYDSNYSMYHGNHPIQSPTTMTCHSEINSFSSSCLSSNQATQQSVPPVFTERVPNMTMTIDADDRYHDVIMSDTFDIDYTHSNPSFAAFD